MSKKNRRKSQGISDGLARRIGIYTSGAAGVHDDQKTGKKSGALRANRQATRSSRRRAAILDQNQ